MAVETLYDAVNAEESVAAEEETAEDTSAVSEQNTEEVDASSHPTSEDVADTTEDKSVPYDRFKEVNDGNKALKSELNQLRKELAEMRQTAQQPQQDNYSELQSVGLDPAAAKELDQYLKSLGYVKQDDAKKLTQSEINELRRANREEEALNALASSYTGDQGGPAFDRDAVIKAVDEVLTDPKAFYEAVHLYQNKESFKDWAAKQAKRQTVVTKTSAESSQKKVGSDREKELAMAKEGNVAAAIRQRFFGG